MARNSVGRNSGFLLRAWPSAVTRVSDVVYATPGGRPLLADLYLPDDTPRPLPTIVWLHPGGWCAGDRRTGPDLSQFIARRGFAMVSIDYRLSGEATFPAAVDDVKASLRWLRSVAGQYGLHPDRIGLWGASAGGHLAALVALSDPAAEVRAVVDAYGPTDFLKRDAAHRAADSYESRFLGAPVDTVPELAKQANPVIWARPDAPPFLILHGSNDTDVPPEQSVLLYEALAATDNDVTLCLIEGLGHDFLRNSFNEGPLTRVQLREWRPGLSEYAADGPPVNFGVIETFFRKHL